MRGTQMCVILGLSYTNLTAKCMQHHLAATSTAEMYSTMEVHHTGKLQQDSLISQGTHSAVNTC